MQPSRPDGKMLEVFVHLEKTKGSLSRL